MTSIANTNGLVHFITGATSLLGSEYLFNVLASDDDTRCSVLIHAKGQRSAEKRLTALLDYLYGRGDMHLHMRQRIEVYGGDIRKKDFGLNQKQLKALESSVNYIFHAASNSNLTDSKSSLNQSNITGTVSVINFAKNCHNLMRLMHVSSAYVSGSKTGKLTPDTLDMDEPTCDHFQLTKRVSEKFVREQYSKLPIVIIRPSTIVGHSVNGRANSFRAFYYPTRQALLGRRVFFPASDDGRAEAVPSDWAADMALKLMLKKGINGRSFHITVGERAYTMEQIKRIIEKNLNQQGVQYRKAKLVSEPAFKYLIGPTLSLFHKHGRKMNHDFVMLSRYSCINRIFDNSDTFKTLGEDRHTLPDLDGYYKNIIRYAIEHDWRDQKEFRR